MPGQKFGPAWFPGLIAVGLILAGGALAAQSLRVRAALIAPPDWLRKARPAIGVASVIAGLLFYVLAADKLGFHFTALVLLGVWMRALGAAWRLTIPVAIVATLLIHLSFYKLLRIPLPWGLLERYAF
jgi:putative tricarboxylic transport membrane protein